MARSPLIGLLAWWRSSGLLNIPQSHLACPTTCPVRSRAASYRSNKTQACPKVDFTEYSGTLRRMSGTANGQAVDSKDDRIVWVDLEMSGLEVESQTIVEMACIVTDADLRIIAESPNLIINHPESVLENMSDWCKENFGKSGLLKAIRASRISLKEAEDVMVSFLRTHTNVKKSPLAGNTIYMDRMFLRKHMPSFDDHLHYRLIDVSSIKELSRRWYPDLLDQQPIKTGSHRAMQDIKESIQELQWYRENVFRNTS